MNSASIALFGLLLAASGSMEPGPVDGGSVSTSRFQDETVSASGRILSPVGLVPTWENTAIVLPHCGKWLGTQVAFGIGGLVQVGTDFVSLVRQTPNLNAKVLLLDRPELRLAAHAELMWIGAPSDDFRFSNFFSRLDTSTAYWVFPVGVTGTWAPLNHLFIHLTTTAQGVASKALPGSQVTFGVNSQIEWTPFKHHAFVLHAGEVGLHHHDYWQIGPSYRYHRWIVDASIGVVVRTFRDGMLPFPVASLGVEL